MQLGTVIAVYGGGNTTLSPVGIGGGTLLFCDNRYLGMIGHVNGKIESAYAAADHQNISFDRFSHNS